MLWRIVSKLVFKVTLSLALVLGVLSYGHYLRGGDPGALWKNIAGNGVSRIVGVLNGSLDGAKREAGAAVAALRSDAGSADAETAGKTEVFTWKDADGVTHFGQMAPPGVASRTVTVDPNVNVLAPVRPSSTGRTENQGATESTGTSELASDDLQAIGGMPGIAGQLPSLGGANPQNKVAQEQLIKMLQQTH